MKSMFRVCATERLFVPDIFPKMQKAIYVDTDLIFLRPVEHLWDFFDHFDDDELKSVIGHECGHIHNDHVVYLTAMHYLRTMAGMFLPWIAGPAMLALSGWSRRAEITCDRAGALCAGSIDHSTRALAKLALGSTKLYEQFNMDAFLDQYQEGQDGVGKFTEVMASHPWLPKRVMALRVFAESSLYRQHIGLEGGKTMDSIDEKVHDVIKVLG